MAIITAQAELPKTGTVAPTLTKPEALTSGQSDINKGAAEAVEENPKEDSNLSPKFAALARKERALRGQYQALKQREEALKAKESEYEAKYVPKERITQDTLGVLQEMGISYDQLTSLILNSGNQEAPEIREIKSELKKLQDQQAKASKFAEESQTKAYEQAITTIRNQTKMLVDSDPNLETIKATQSEESVVGYIRETFEQTGNLLTVEEAAQHVEDYLLEEMTKLAQLKKIQSRLNPQPVEAPAQKSQPQLKTLTSDVTTGSKSLTPKEKRERAIAAFRGQLTT